MKDERRDIVVKNRFRWGRDDLGLDDSRSTVSVAAKLLTIELHAAHAPPGSGDWAVYPPLLYARGVPLSRFDGEGTLVIDDEALDEHDLALYMLEHHDIHGSLTYRSGTVAFTGTAEMFGCPESIPLEVSWSVD